MADFSDTYLGQLRAEVGNRLLLVPGARIVLLNSNGEILLQKRSDFNVWGLPGGNAEIGEDLETVIVRETLEETGLHVTDVIPYGFGCDPAIETVTYPNGDRCQHFALNFYSRSFLGDPHVADDESTEIGWFKRNALPKMLISMQRSVEAYDRFEESGQFQMI